MMNCDCTDGMLNFSIVSNNDVLVEFDVTYLSTGLPINLTGANIKWQLFATGTRNPLITKMTADGTILIPNQSLTPGRFRFQILPPDTAAFATAYYPHEAVITTADGNSTTVTTGDPEVRYGTAYVRQELTDQNL